MDTIDSGWLATPWYDWTDTHDVVNRVAHAINVTAARLKERGADSSVGWDDFGRHINDTFGGPDWWYNPVMQRVLAAAEPNGYPLQLTDRQWLDAATVAQTALESWRHDTTDLVNLAAKLNVDPVAYGWTNDPTMYFGDYVKYHISQSAALPSVTTVNSWFGTTFSPDDIVSLYRKYLADGVKLREADGVRSAQWRTLDDIANFYHQGADNQDEVLPNFAEYLKSHLITRNGALPTTAEIGSWYGRELLPAAVVSQFQADFPTGVPTPSGTVLSLDEVRRFYLEQGSADASDIAANFAGYVRYYMSEGAGLPDAVTIGKWFDRELLPEAIVARFQTDFPTGVPTLDGSVLSMDDVGEFYLGADIWAATNQLQNEDLDPEFVQEILDLFASEEPLDEAGMTKVKAAIDAGVITFEDDD